MDHPQKVVEDKICVYRTRGRFGMKLYASEGQIAVSYAFVGTVVGIDEPCFPGAGKTFYVDRIAVILRGHVAAVCADFNAWLILTSMTKLQLVCVSSSSQSKNPHPQAATHKR